MAGGGGGASLTSVQGGLKICDMQISDFNDKQILLTSLLFLTDQIIFHSLLNKGTQVTTTNT